jgi:hypothetical protein
VLASGDIVNANAKENSDLYRALKGCSNNLGIVTRFDLRSFPLTKLWGGLVMSGISNANSQYQKLANLIEDYDPNAMAIVISAWSAGNQSPDGFIMGTALVNTAGDPNSDSLRPLTEMEPKWISTLRESTIIDFAGEAFRLFARHKRYA